MADAARTTTPRAIHPLFIRVTHWVNALAIFVMVLSGWRIYNASPLFRFEFPPGFTLGGWLAGALAWHFAAMWLLALNGAAYVAYGIVSGHFRRRFLPISFGRALDDVVHASQGRLEHAPGRYNAAQRLLYVGVILAVIVAILSGLAIWKPVQLQGLTALMGGYETARLVHFFAMAGIVAFLVVHIGLAVGVKGVLAPMFTGRAQESR
ncbi:cytochrome b/b6 domain-containing protein [Methylocystis sp.]|uniref:cytochrome b/b6 domain-containing protein n=1 Tax=Methylocystis sp. TaxID=1911079 RepID=UPI003D0DBB9D